jgi:hypothetical protein
LLNPIKVAIDLYCELVSPEKMAGRDLTRTAEDLYTLFKSNSGLDSALSQIVRVENMKRGMTYYIAAYKPEISSLIKAISIDEQTLLSDLNKKLSPDSSYLWIIGDTDRQIDNVYAEYSLIDALNKVTSNKSLNLDAGSREIQKRLNHIKLPLRLLLDVRPDMKDILEVLTRVAHQDIPDTAVFADRVEKGAAVFDDFFSHQLDIFRQAVGRKTGALTEREGNYLFEQTPDTALYEEVDVFMQTVQSKLGAYRKSQRINQLKELWREESNSESPRDWSYKNRIPILCLFEDSAEDYSLIFDYLNESNQPNTEESVIHAEKILEQKVFPKIKDLETCDSAFVSYFSGKYLALIKDAEELKDALIKALGGTVYHWTNQRKAADRAVANFAREKYATTYKQQVVNRINSLTADEAQKMLMDLAEDEPLVGIQLLK